MEEPRSEDCDVTRQILTEALNPSLIGDTAKEHKNHLGTTQE